MEKEKIDAYVRRISQANKSQYAAILCELFLEFADEAQTAGEMGEKEKAVSELKKCQKVNAELMNCLNKENPVSKVALKINVKIGEHLVDAILKQDLTKVKEACDMIDALKEQYDILAKEDKDQPVMENAGQVYAGLTYGKGVLNETCIQDPKTNREYTV